MKHIAGLVTQLAGAGLVALGLYLVHPAAAYIVAGLALVFFGSALLEQHTPEAPQGAPERA